MSSRVAWILLLAACTLRRADGDSRREEFTYLPTVDDGLSEAIPISEGFLLGGLAHYVAYVSTNGYIIFTNPRSVFNPVPVDDPRSLEFIVAPYWADADLRLGGAILYKVYQEGVELEKINKHIQATLGIRFEGRWMLFVEWDEVLQFGRRNGPNNSLAASIVTDGLQSYAVFRYQCGGLNWPTAGSRSAVSIGYRSTDMCFENHQCSFSGCATDVDCLTNSSTTLLYKLSQSNSTCALDPAKTAVYLCFNARNCGNNYTQHTLVCDLPVRPEDGYIASSADSCCSGSGLSYFAMNSSMEGNDRCYMCHVSSWTSGSITAHNERTVILSETDDTIILEYNIVKGFNSLVTEVTVIEGTADANSDFRILHINDGRLPFSSQLPRFPFILHTVELVVSRDDVALEQDETFVMVVGVQERPPLTNCLPSINFQQIEFLSNIVVVIKDTTSISAKFSEMEYSQVEGNTLLVLVSISTNIATDLNLRVVPHNLSDFAGGNRVLNTTASFFIMFPHHLPDSIVSANGHSQNRDYESRVVEVNFEPGGPTTKQVLIELFEDEIDEADLEYFVVTLETDNPKVNISRDHSVALCAIVDNDVTVIGFERSSYTFHENVSKPEIFLTFESNLTADFTIIISLMAGFGTAVIDEDYHFSKHNLTIDPIEFVHQKTVRISGISLLNDDVRFEGTEYFEVHLINVTNFKVGRNSKTVVCIVDDDGMIMFDKDIYYADESNGSVMMRIEHTILDKEIAIDYFTEDGSATSDADYASILSVLFFAVGVQRQNITITINDDVIPERDENFFVHLNITSVGADISSSSVISTEVVIQGNDRVTCYSDDICETALSMSEAARTLEADSCCLHNMGYSFSPPDNTSTCVVCFVLGWIDGHATDSRTSITKESTILLPEGTAQSLHYGYLKPLGFHRSIEYYLSIDMTNITADNKDFSIDRLHQVSFPGEVVVFAHHDAIGLENVDYFVLLLEEEPPPIISNNPGIFTVQIEKLTVVIQDETRVLVQFSLFNYVAFEGQRSIDLHLFVDASTENDLLLRVVSMDLTEVYDGFYVSITPLPKNITLPHQFPQLPSFLPEQPYIANKKDYEPVNKTVRIKAGQGRARAVNTAIKITDDEINEALEQYFVVMLNIDQSTTPDTVDIESGRFVALCTIVDNDDLSFGFEEESYTMFEDEDAGNLVFIISIEGTTSEQTFNISVVATSITAQENEDFKVMQVVFPANSTRIAVPLKFVNDSRLELVESFRLQLVYGGIGTPFQVGGNIVTTVFINDDDEVKPIYFERKVYTVLEHLEAVNITVINKEGVDANSTAFFTTLREKEIGASIGTAQANVDYLFAERQELLLDSERNTITISIIDDSIAEGKELIRGILVVTQSSHIFDSYHDMVEITIDDAPVIGFANEEYYVDESKETITLIVTKFGDISENLTIQVTTEGLSTDASDYVLINPTVIFTAEDVEMEVVINVTADADVEGEEIFNCILHAERGILLSPAVAMVTIGDDDTIASLHVHKSSMNAISSTVTMTTTASHTEIFLSHSPSATPSALLRPSSTQSNALAITLGYSLGTATLLLVVAMVIIVCVFLCWRGRVKTRNDIETLDEMDHHVLKRSTAPRQLRGMTRIVKAKKVISNCNIRLLDSIGEGEFGIVYKAHLIVDVNGMPELVAVKTMKHCYSVDNNSALLRESTRMMDLDHPNVLGLIGVCTDGGPAPYLIMPYMAQGSLLSYLKKHRTELVFLDVAEQNEDKRSKTEKKLLDMCLQIAKGMKYLTSCRLIHRDLAARNCMLDYHGVVKVADFGLTEETYSQNYFRQGQESTMRFPVKWMAPESLSNGLFTEATDVWSFGVTCWEVYSGGCSPYPGIDPFTLQQQLALGKRLDKPLNTVCGSEVYDTMLSCWKMDPTERLEFSQLVVSLSWILDQLAGYFDLSADYHKAQFGSLRNGSEQKRNSNVDINQRGQPESVSHPGSAFPPSKDEASKIQEGNQCVASAENVPREEREERYVTSLF